MKKIAIAWCVGVLLCIIVVSIMLPTVGARTSISISRDVAGSGLQDESTEIRTSGNVSGGIRAALTARGSGDAASKETYEVTTGSEEKIDTKLEASREYGNIMFHNETYDTLFSARQTFSNYNVGSVITNEYEESYIIAEKEETISTKEETGVVIASVASGTAIDHLLVRDPVSMAKIMESTNEYKGNWTRDLSYLIQYTRDYGDNAGWLGCP